MYLLGYRNITFFSAWNLDWECFGPLQQAALVLNASRRFRYTLDLKKEEEKEQRRRMIRSHAQVIRVMFLVLTNILIYFFGLLLFLINEYFLF